MILVNKTNTATKINMEIKIVRVTLPLKKFLCILNFLIQLSKEFPSPHKMYKKIKIFMALHNYIWIKKLSQLGFKED